jgi:hypothetical protein
MPPGQAGHAAADEVWQARIVAMKSPILGYVHVFHVTTG